MTDAADIVGKHGGFHASGHLRFEIVNLQA